VVSLLSESQIDADYRMTQILYLSDLRIHTDFADITNFLLPHPFAIQEEPIWLTAEKDFRNDNNKIIDQNKMKKELRRGSFFTI
jgi:hypothetical protein